MNKSKKRKSPVLSLVALPLAASLLLAGCSLIGGDDAADSANLDATGTTVAAEAPAEEATTTTVASTVPEIDPAIEEGLRVGRTGPIRELPGLSEWADLDLKPFMMEVMLFPEEVPVPSNAILTSVSVSQRFENAGASSKFEIYSYYQPLFSMDEFKELMPALLSDSGWTAAGIDEDLEDHSIRLDFTSEDSALTYNEISLTYTDGDTSNQADLRVYAVGDYVDGRSEVVVNEILFPWMNEVVVDPAMVNWFVTYNIGRLTGKVEIDRRWSAPPADFERLSNIYRTPTGAGFVADGEMEYDDTVWPTNDIEIVRDDGFDGRISITQTDPEDSVSVQLSGWYLFE